MRAFLVCVLFALAISCVAAQTRPRLSETFESKGHVSLKSNNTDYYGEGWYHVSQPDGKALEVFDFRGAEHLNVFELQRYDKGRSYEVIFVAHNKTPICHTKPLTGKMPVLWDWVEKADFQRNLTAKGHTYALWAYTFAGITLEVATPVDNPDVLAFLGRRSAGFDFRYFVNEYKTAKPHSTWFDIPRECHFGPKN